MSSPVPRDDFNYAGAPVLGVTFFLLSPCSLSASSPLRLAEILEYRVNAPQKQQCFQLNTGTCTGTCTFINRIFSLTKFSLKSDEEWQKLNYDIYTLRQIRREVRNRWKRILEDLGFQREADSLLSVTKLSTISDSKNTRKAREMLLKLAEETNIFPTSWELSERYLFVVDRLIALDAAEEFFKLARRTYPKKPGVPCVADAWKELHYPPFPSP
ncbi:melanoregulin isoform X2 [Aotus nancymaae]|uniref:melanoregulin isoform X2 n=1 Tax=Aotus nancymaae TaxID=37293 RepID=UPI0030FE5DBF